jgi:hypothetical protein
MLLEWLLGEGKYFIFDFMEAYRAKLNYNDILLLSTLLMNVDMQEQMNLAFHLVLLLILKLYKTTLSH